MSVTTQLTVSDFPGFYAIPGFRLYAITRDGRVINRETSVSLLGSINPAGYCHYRLRNDVGRIITIGRHRLLGLAFMYPEADPATLVINHRNGVKGDDRLENLEWITPKANVEHAGALGITTKCRPISVRDVDTETVVNYPSFVECAKALGLSKDAIAYRMRTGDGRVFPERKQYRFAYTDKPWYIPQDVDCSLMANGTSKQVLVRKVMTGEVIHFHKLSDLAAWLHIAPSTLSTWMDKGGQPVLPGLVQLKWANDTSPWRVVSDPYLEHNQTSGKRAVQVVDSKTNVARVFLSAQECAIEHGLSPTALNYRLKSNGSVVYGDGYRYGYYRYAI